MDYAFFGDDDFCRAAHSPRWERNFKSSVLACDQMEAIMAALLREDGEFVPMPVVRDTAKLKQLVDSMDKKVEAPKGFVAALRAARRGYSVSSK